MHVLLLLSYSPAFRLRTHYFNRLLGRFWLCASEASTVPSVQVTIVLRTCHREVTNASEEKNGAGTVTRARENPQSRKSADHYCRQGRYFGTGLGADEAFKVVVFRSFAGALNVAVAGCGQGGAPGLESFSGNGKTGPVADEALLGQCAVMFLEGDGMA